MHIYWQNVHILIVLLLSNFYSLFNKRSLKNILPNFYNYRLKLKIIVNLIHILFIRKLYSAMKSKINLIKDLI